MLVCNIFLNYKFKRDKMFRINWIHKTDCWNHFRCEWKYLAIDRSFPTMRPRRCDFIHFCNDGGRLSGASGHFEWTKPLRVRTNEWRESWRRKRKWRKVDCWLVEKLMGRVVGLGWRGCGEFKGQYREFWSRCRYWMASFK